MASSPMTKSTKWKSRPFISKIAKMPKTPQIRPSQNISSFQIPQIQNFSTQIIWTKLPKPNGLLGRVDLQNPIWTGGISNRWKNSSIFSINKNFGNIEKIWKKCLKKSSAKKLRRKIFVRKSWGAWSRICTILNIRGSTRISSLTRSKVPWGRNWSIWKICSKIRPWKSRAPPSPKTRVSSRNDSPGSMPRLNKWKSYMEIWPNKCTSKIWPGLWNLSWTKSWAISPKCQIGPKSTIRGSSRTPSPTGSRDRPSSSSIIWSKSSSEIEIFISSKVWNASRKNGSPRTSARNLKMGPIRSWRTWNWMLEVVWRGIIGRDQIFRRGGSKCLKGLNMGQMWVWEKMGRLGQGWTLLRLKKAFWAARKMLNCKPSQHQWASEPKQPKPNLNSLPIKVNQNHLNKSQCLTNSSNLLPTK